jgi:hypothetical protein
LELRADLDSVVLPVRVSNDGERLLTRPQPGNRLRLDTLFDEPLTVGDGELEGTVLIGAVACRSSLDVVGRVEIVSVRKRKRLRFLPCVIEGSVGPNPLEASTNSPRDAPV